MENCNGVAGGYKDYGSQFGSLLIVLTLIGNLAKNDFNNNNPFKLTAETEKIGQILLDCIDKLTVSISLTSVLFLTKNGNFLTFYDFKISTNFPIVS